MKNQTNTHTSLKTVALRATTRKIFLLVFTFLSMNAYVNFQAIGTWNFNGTNTGVAGLFTALLPADFSPAIPTHAYNSTVYFGEGGWPAGPVDPAAYFEFGVAPLLGSSLNISNMAITLRRSSTGSSGSGPTRFVIRSSMDGFTSDLASGTLTPSAQVVNLTPGSSFISLLLGVRFRIYGYQSVISSGGLSRLVMEQIQVNGLGSVLPAHITGFSAKLRDELGEVSYSITNNEPGTRYEIQRATDGRNFTTVQSLDGTSRGTDFSFQYQETLRLLNSTLFYYRLNIITPSGASIYSDVSLINLSGKSVSPLQVMQQASTVRVRSGLTGARSLQIFTTSGQLVRTASIAENVFSSTVDLPQHLSGVYFVHVTNGQAKESTTIYLK